MDFLFRPLHISFDDDDDDDDDDDGVRKPVQKSIAQLIAMIAKHDLPDNQWPALFQFLEQYIRSDDAAQREVSWVVAE